MMMKSANEVGSKMNGYSKRFRWQLLLLLLMMTAMLMMPLFTIGGGDDGPCKMEEKDATERVSGVSGLTSHFFLSFSFPRPSAQIVTGGLPGLSSSMGGLQVSQSFTRVMN